MNPVIQIILTLVLVFLPEFVIIGVRRSIRGISRPVFSLIVSLAIGVQLFLLSIIYLDTKPLLIGGALFIVAIAGGYPSAYLLFPWFMRTEESLIQKVE
jgi:hypothetical protein